MTDTDRAVLDLEGRFWKHTGTKEAAIRAELDMSPTRYYQHLVGLLEDPEALAYAPLVIHRLRRLRGARRRPLDRPRTP